MDRLLIQLEIHLDIGTVTGSPMMSQKVYFHVFTRFLRLIFNISAENYL